MRGIKPMKCNVICTFDKFDEDYEKQVFYDFFVLIEKGDKNLEEFITNVLFRKIAEEVKKDKRGVEWLATVSTSCDWYTYSKMTKNDDLTELGNGKWDFAECSSYKLTEGSLGWKLKQKYGFGTKCDCSWFWENANDRQKSLDAYLCYLLNNSRLDWVTSNA